jgi:hypothetical protein
MSAFEGTRLDWRKSSHSSQTGNCVEIATWHKSSHRGVADNCIEAAGARPVLVRDTTDRGGRVLAFPAGAWRALLTHVRTQ